MKKLFFSLMALAATASVSAQDLAEGDYYLRNVESGKYIAWGANWGTRTVLTEHGALLRVTVADGKYTLKNCSKNTEYGKAIRPSDGFADQSGTWTVTPVGDGTYTVKGDNGFYRYDGTALPAVNGTEGQTGIYWEFLSKTELNSRMTSATATSPADATHFIASPDFLVDDWQFVTNKAWGINIPMKNDQPHVQPMDGPNNTIINNTNCEIWNTNNSNIKQTLTGLPKGTYKLSCFGFYRDGGPADAAANRTAGTETLRAFVYAGDAEVALMSILEYAGAHGIAGTNTSFGNVPNSNEQAALHFAAGDYVNEIYFQVTEDNGSVTIGIRKDETSSNDWTVFDNFDLKYFGDCSIAEAQNAAIVAEWNDFVAEYDAKAAALDAAGQSSYDIAKAGITTPTSAEALATAKDALAAAYIAAIKAQTSTNADFTALLVNPSFETGTLEGWTNNSASGMWTVMNRANADDPKVGTYWIEKYGNGGKIDLTQTVTGLPGGHYQVSVLALDQASKVRLVANSASTAVVGGTKAVYTVDVMLDDNSDLTLGMYSETHQANSWVGVDDFHLTYVSSEFPALPTAVEGKMNAEIAAAQTAAIEAYGAEQTSANYNAVVAAIAAAQESKTLYEKAAANLIKANEILNSTNVYTAEAHTAFETAISGIQTKYDEGTLAAADDAEVNAIVGPANYTKPTNVMTTYVASAWTATNGVSVYTNDWSVEGAQAGNSGLSTPFIENWVADTQKLANTEVSATMTDLENGLYRFTADVRLMNNKTGDNAGFDGVTFFANDVTPEMPEATTYPDGNLYQISIEALVKDGNLKMGYTVVNTNISWVAMKNVKYTKVRDLTPEEQMVPATEEEIADLNEAIAAAEAKTIGYQEGEYAPYTNKDAIKTLADAKAIDTTVPVDAEVVKDATKALKDATWTVNAEEMNALENADFEGSYAAVSGAGVSADREIYLPEGWSFRKNGININDIVVLKTSDKAGNNVTSIAALDNGGNNTLMYRGKWGNTTNLDFYQKVTLPAGTYTLECDAWKSGLGGDGKIYAGAGNEITLDGNETSWRKLSLEFTLDEEKTMEIGFNIKHNSDGSEKFIGFDNFVLKRTTADANLAINADYGVGTFVAPFDVTPDEYGVEAYKIKGMENGYLQLEQVSTIEHHTPVITMAETAVNATITKAIAQGEIRPEFVGEGAKLVGNLTGVGYSVTQNDGNFVLQKQNDKVGFYKVGSKVISLPNNRCYLHIDEVSEIKGIFFENLDGTTAIKGIEDATAANILYNLSGQRIQKTQKGINIVNGKKVVIK